MFARVDVLNWVGKAAEEEFKVRGDKRDRDWGEYGIYMAY